MFFSLGQTDEHRYRDSPLPKTPSRMEDGQFIISKIIEIVATTCHISRLKCTKNSISAGAPPQTPLGELTALPQTP